MKRVLILSCNTGQGHNSAALALAARFETLGVGAEVKDALSFAPEGVSDLVSGIHNASVVYAPGLFRAGDRGARRECRRERPTVCYRANAAYAPALEKAVAQGGFSAVVATHVFPAEALTYLVRQGMAELPCFFVATDYNCTPFVGETDLSGYFIPHEDLVEEFVREGVRPDRLMATGIPVAVPFERRLPAAGAREQLGLDPKRPLALIMTGSMGAGKTGELARALRAAAPEAGILLFAGHNEKRRQELNRDFAEDPLVTVLDYTKEVDRYLDAGDVLLSKPGGLSITEAACKEIPLVLADPLPGWETDNVTFFCKHGLALPGKTPQEQAQAAANLLRDEDACRRMREAQRETMRPGAAADICQWVAAAMG